MEPCVRTAYTCLCALLTFYFSTNFPVCKLSPVSKYDYGDLSRRPTNNKYYLFHDQLADHTIFNVSSKPANDLIFAGFRGCSEGVTLGGARLDLIQLPKDVSFILVTKWWGDRCAKFHDGKFMLNCSIVFDVEVYRIARGNGNSGRVVGVVDPRIWTVF